MINWLGIVAGTLRSLLRTQRELALENLVLRQQLAVLKLRYPRPRLKDVDRLFWVLLSRVWSGWRECLHIVQPETVGPTTDRSGLHTTPFRTSPETLAARPGSPRASETVSAHIPHPSSLHLGNLSNQIAAFYLHIVKQGTRLVRFTRYSQAILEHLRWFPARSGSLQFPSDAVRTG